MRLAPFTFGPADSSVAGLCTAQFGVELAQYTDVRQLCARIPREYRCVEFFYSDTEGTSISSGVQLIATMFAVPPQSVVVFEVALELDYKNDPVGDIEADFESGDFQIACPVVVVELLNSPPGAVA